MSLRLLRALAVLAALACASPALASFHLIKIVEVFPGTTASPNAQYVVLQMYSSGQTLVGGQSLAVYDADGNELGTFTFTGNVANGADQSKILIATAQAASFFSITPNLTITPVIRGSGGKICWAGGVDCVAWGNYRGPSTGVGTPFRVAPDGASIPPGRTMNRRLNIAGLPNNLDAGDDTNNCANDFVLGTPAPKNNAGQTGVVPSSTCGNGTIEGLEACDDHNLANGDGCSQSCVYEGLVAVGDPAFEGDRLRAGPNPFRASTTILLALSRPSHADVSVYDLGGRRVRSLWNGTLESGPHDIQWDGQSDAGERVRPGVYVVRLRTDGRESRVFVTRIP